MKFEGGGNKVIRLVTGFQSRKLERKMNLNQVCFEKGLCVL